jgi:hypothetical protein
VAAETASGRRATVKWTRRRRVSHFSAFDSLQPRPRPAGLWRTRWNPYLDPELGRNCLVVRQADRERRPARNRAEECRGAYVRTESTMGGVPAAVVRTSRFAVIQLMDRTHCW